MPSTTKPEPTFLWPAVERFAVDSICNLIVRELDARSWQVPGIEVEFDSYGSGEAKYSLVRLVKGEDFELRFGRPVGRLGNKYNNCSGIATIKIPELELELFENDAMWLYTYTGDDWAADKDRFMHHIKVNSKLNNEGPWYLKYDARSRAGRFVVDTDLDRQYDATGDQPKTIPAPVALDRIVGWLTKNVADPILAVEPTAAEDYVSPQEHLRVEPIAVRQDLPSIYCIGEPNDAWRIRNIDNPDYGHDPSERYGMHISWRLLGLDNRNDGTVPQIAYEGFVWCGLSAMTATTSPKELELDHSWLSAKDRCYVFAVKLNRQNDVYICDNAEFLKKRVELAETLGDRDRYSDQEVTEMHLARARTLVPIGEYDFATNPYEQPLVLIARELDLDEVEIVSGPWRYEMRDYHLVPEEN